MEYLDHNGDRYQKDEFLSGDVKTKLEAFHDEYGLPKFSNEENTAFYQKIAYDDLKAVIPDDIELPLIDIPLGANWLDKNITDSFLRDIIGLQNLTTNYIHGKGFSIHFTHVGDREFLIATGKDFYKQTGMEYVSGIKYIEDMLNNKTLLVQKTIQLNGAKEKMTIKDPIATQGLENLKKQLQREFKQYILDNDTFATTAQKQYNDTFNREVRRKYDGSHIQLIGANKDIELREHQKNASYRFFQERSVLLAHDVGTGKSYTMIASALEGKRMKLYNKPIIIAPNHIAPQLAVDARKLYPNANIKLVQAVSRKNKNKELASLKNNKHDLIIGTLTAFTNMNVSPNLFNKYMEQEIKYLKKIKDELVNKTNISTRDIKGIERRIDNAKKQNKGLYR